MPPHTSTSRSLVAVLTIALTTMACGGRTGESSATATPAPSVGELAPSFSVRAVGREGPRAEPVSMDALKGKTVVLAFFPKARTPGCTTQMKAYRDRYASLFNDGKDVVLLGVSTDDEETLISWAKEEQFPFLFVSDKDGALGAQFGALEKGDWFADRVLYVIAPDGKVTYKVAPFRQSSEAAYVSLDSAIDQVASR